MGKGYEDVEIREGYTYKKTDSVKPADLAIAELFAERVIRTPEHDRMVLTEERESEELHLGFRVRTIYYHTWSNPRRSADRSVVIDVYKQSRGADHQGGAYWEAQRAVILMAGHNIFYRRIPQQGERSVWWREIGCRPDTALDLSGMTAGDAERRWAKCAPMLRQNLLVTNGDLDAEYLGKTYIPQLPFSHLRHHFKADALEKIAGILSKPEFA